MNQDNNVMIDENKSFESKYLMMGIVAVVISLLWWYVSNPITISVTGSGKVVVPASSATSSVTVAATGVDAASAITTLNTKIESVRQIMIKGNVTDDNIAQSQPQVTPAALVVAGATGYQATATIAFKTRYVSDLPNLIGQLYANGATVVAQATYLAENQEESERTAMKQAMEMANTEAKYFARSKWKLIRKIVAVQQASSGTSSQAAVKDSTSKDEMVIANGGVQIAKAVQVTYRMW